MYAADGISGSASVRLLGRLARQMCAVQNTSNSSVVIAARACSTLKVHAQCAQGTCMCSVGLLFTSMLLFIIKWIHLCLSCNTLEFAHQLCTNRSIDVHVTTNYLFRSSDGLE